MLGGSDNYGSRLNRPELTDYLDADGGIVLPEGTNVVTFLDRHIADIGDAVAYRYLDYSQHADGKMIELTRAHQGSDHRRWPQPLSARYRGHHGRGVAQSAIGFCRSPAA